ncbi:MAG: ROK family transcriptional regulator [Hyphomicrobiaceae bacterium]
MILPLSGQKLPQNQFLRSDDLRRRNRRRVLSAVRTQARISRTDISTETGLSAATVSAITSDLLQEDVLRRCEQDPGRTMGGDVVRGRPKSVLSLNPSVGVVGAVNLQLNAITATIIDYSGQVMAQQDVEIDTLKASGQALRRGLLGCLRKALAQIGANNVQVRNVAVGVQGTIDQSGERLLWSPITHCRNLQIQSWVEGEFGASTLAHNDCDLIATALHHRDPARFGQNFAAILLAHGVGMGLVLRGLPVNGTRSSGTEFGHMVYIPEGALCRCGSHGCIEAYAGDYAISRRTSKAPETSEPVEFVHPDQVERIACSALCGDPTTKAAIEEAGQALGSGLASIFALVDPFPIALIGSLTSTRTILEPAIRCALARTMARRNIDEFEGNIAESLEISFFPDSAELVQFGGHLHALMALDDEIANVA